MWQQTNCIMIVYDICIEILNGGIMGAFLIFCMIVQSGKILIVIIMDAGVAF